MIERCNKCGFILHTKPELKEIGGTCLACINQDNKKFIDFKERQIWLTRYIKRNRTNSKYDCVVAVSGGKDSHAIVKRLIENHDAINPLLVSVTDEFTHTKAGIHNINNLVNKYDLDLITFRCQPQQFKVNTYYDFVNELHPLKWIEEKIYKIPIEIAKQFGIKLVFFGENSSYEYGLGDELNIFHPSSDSETHIIFMGAIYPYSISDSLGEARSIGFKDLDDFNEWPRKGSIEQYTQIDSIAYIIQLWTKFPKFGFQRVSDIACRFVREGQFKREQAIKLIEEKDHVCDPMAKEDFCKTINITESFFNETVDKHMNKNLIYKDGEIWRLINQK